MSKEVTLGLLASLVLGLQVCHLILCRAADLIGGIVGRRCRRALGFPPSGHHCETAHE